MKNPSGKTKKAIFDYAPFIRALNGEIASLVRPFLLDSYFCLSFIVGLVVEAGN